MVFKKLSFCTFLITGKFKTAKTNDDIKRRRAFFCQLINCLSGYILMLDVGANSMWSSPALPYLTSENSTIPMTITQGAFLVGSQPLFGIIGCLMCPLIIDRIGRKYTILLLGLIQLMSKILIFMATNYIFLMTSKMLYSIAAMGTLAYLPLYIGEISAEDIRGRLLIFDKVCANLGAFLMSIAAAFLSYNSMNLVMISIPLIAIFIFPLTEETPYYYLMKRRDKEAIETLMKLSAEKKVENVMADIKRMKQVIIEGKDSKKTGLRELFSDRGSRRALMIKMIAETTYIFSGYHGIQAYAQEIFSNSGSSLGAEYSVMIMTGIPIFAGLPSSQIIDHWGRRPTFLLSGVLSALSLAIVGLFFFLKFFLKVDVSCITWLPLVSLISFTFSCNIGLSTIPYVYRGELFSVKVKAVATMFSSIIASIFVFVSKMLLPLLNHSVGIYSSFWIFGIICFVGSVTGFCIAPETKGKNLEEILELLNHAKKTMSRKCDSDVEVASVKDSVNEK